MEDEVTTSLLSPVKVLLIDDDAFNREGVRLYLSQKGFHVLEASDVATARRTVAEYHPDVLVVDIVIPPSTNSRFQMSQSAGIQLASHLKHAYPALAVVFFSAHENRGSEVWDMVREGMRGIAYVLKGRQPGVLLDAIQATLAGQVVIDPEVLMNPHSLADDLLEQLTPEERPWIELAAARLNQLSPREREAANRLAASHNTEGIARSLGITPKTVENYITQISNISQRQSFVLERLYYCQQRSPGQHWRLVCPENTGAGGSFAYGTALHSPPDRHNRSQCLLEYPGLMARRFWSSLTLANAQL